VTRQHLDEAIDELSVALSALRGRTDAAAVHDLTFHADTLTDIARTFSMERADAGSADVLACAEALLGSIESHRRDLDLEAAWSRLPAVPATEPPVVVNAAAADRTNRGGVAVVEPKPMPVDAAAATGRADVAARALKARLEAGIRLTETMFEAMDFRLVFDADRQLLSIGYQVVEGRCDASAYDLLASEARLASSCRGPGRCSST
jgi:hypothetical protein